MASAPSLTSMVSNILNFAASASMEEDDDDLTSGSSGGHKLLNPTRPSLRLASHLSNPPIKPVRSVG